MPSQPNGVTHKCQCPRCFASPKPSYSQSHLLACEARLLLTWPLAQRCEYLAKLPDRRRLPLQAEMTRQFEASK